MLKLIVGIFFVIILGLYIFTLFLSSSDSEEDNYILRVLEFGYTLFEESTKKSNRCGKILGKILINLCFLLIKGRKNKDNQYN